LLCRTGESELPQLGCDDWRLQRSDIIICKNADGSEALLGAGAYGKASDGAAWASAWITLVHRYPQM